jgi:hypothetical protein
MQNGMEIQYHNWRVTYILVTFREVQFEFELLRIGVDFQEYEAFRT